MPAPDTLPPLVHDAARRAVREDGALAVLVFGSHARGEVTDESDIDLAVVTDGRPERAACAFERRLARHLDVDVLAKDLHDLRSDTRAGSVWENIVRQGRVIAGHVNGLREVPIMPASGKDIARDLGTISATKTMLCLTAITSASLDEQDLPPADRTQIETDGSETERSASQAAARLSVEAAEHVVKALTKLLDVREGRKHNMFTATERLSERAEQIRQKASHVQAQGRESEQAEHIKALADTVWRLNGKAKGSYLATHRSRVPPMQETTTRLVRAMSLQAQALRGIIKGDGPLWWIATAAAGRLTSREEAASDLAQMRTVARSGAAMMVKAGTQAKSSIEALEDDQTRARLRRAIDAWTDAGERLRAGGFESRAEDARLIHLARSTHADAKVRADAAVHLTAFRSSREGAQDTLRRHLENDTAIGSDPNLRHQMETRITLLDQAPHVVGQEAAIKAAAGTHSEALETQQAGAPPQGRQTPEAEAKYRSAQWENTPDGQRALRAAADRMHTLDKKHTER